MKFPPASSWPHDFSARQQGGKPAMTQQEFQRYVDAFNRGDYKAAVATWFSEDLVFEGKDLRIEGSDAVLAFFIQGHEGMDERLTVERFTSQGDLITVELCCELAFHVDKPDFVVRPSKKGETYAFNMFVDYLVRDGRFTRISISH
jgi:limonene-1,2-epoxide hydrolase